MPEEARRETGAVLDFPYTKNKSSEKERKMGILGTSYTKGLNLELMNASHFIKHMSLFLLLPPSLTHHKYKSKADGNEVWMKNR